MTYLRSTSTLSCKKRKSEFVAKTQFLRNDLMNTFLRSKHSDQTNWLNTTNSHFLTNTKVPKSSGCKDKRARKYEFLWHQVQCFKKHFGLYILLSFIRILSSSLLFKRSSHLSRKIRRMPQTIILYDYCKVVTFDHSFTYSIKHIYFYFTFLHF